MRRRWLICVWLACTPGPGAPDGGDDAGSAAPRQHCVRSSCNAEGTWRVVYSGAPAPDLLCRPVREQLRFTSDGVTVCMLDASDGGSDGGCGLDFVVEVRGDGGLAITDTWALEIPDAGHMYGTWSTTVTGLASCAARYSMHAVK